MLTEASRERAMQKAKEKAGITGDIPDYWSSDPNDRKLREDLRQWYFYYSREEQARQERVARVNRKLEDFT